MIILITKKCSNIVPLRLDLKFKVIIIFFFNIILKLIYLDYASKTIVTGSFRNSNGPS